MLALIYFILGAIDWYFLKIVCLASGNNPPRIKNGIPAPKLYKSNAKTAVTPSKLVIIVIAEKKTGKAQGAAIKV